VTTHDAFAQSGSNRRGVARKMMENLVKRTAKQSGKSASDRVELQLMGITPLRVEGAENTTCGKNNENCINQEVKTTGPNSSEDYRVMFRPMKSLRQVMNADAIRKMYKDLMTSRVAVLFTTMQMVENGAAAGFANAVKVSSDNIDRTYAAASLQLDMLESIDPSGQEKIAYAAGVYDRTKENKGGAWGLMAAVGDSMEKGSGGTGAGTGAGNDEDLNSLAKATPYSVAEIRKDSSSGTGAAPPASAGSGKKKLSELLFDNRKGDGSSSSGPSGGPSGSGGTSTYDNDNIDELKNEFIELLGDIEIEEKDDAAGIRKINLKRLPYDKKGGPAHEEYEEVKIVWEAWFNILKGYCEFKKENPNNSKQMFQKDTTTTTDKINAEYWQQVSAPDIPVSMNLVDQAFALVQKQKHEKELNCNDLSPDQNEPPIKDDGVSGDNLDDCKNGKGCMRNKLFLYVVHILARSRMLHTYDAMYMVASRFATDPGLQQLVDKLFRDTFENLDTQTEMQINRTRYTEFLAFMGKLSQGQVGAGAFFRPNENFNVVNRADGTK